MKTSLKTSLVAIALLSACGAAMAVPFTGTFSENFDSMGAAGTAPPTGWVVKTGNSGTTNATWTSSIPANGANSVAAMVNAATPLTVITTPTATNNNGYNAQNPAGPAGNRALSTSPTTVSGGALDLVLTNNTGASISSIDLAYDIIRFNAPATANELPGYQIFYTLDGTTWTNVPALNPTLAGPGGIIVPNTVGTTSVPTSSVPLSSAWAIGTDLHIRWVDDNANQTSPDQILALDNVNVTTTAVPEPASLSLLAIGTLGILARRRKA